MAAIAKRIVFDAATRELWRVAESGETDALAGILARGVDIDARNEHGMTALMRAANNGHEQMVRALLEHGTDPNITRNDRFTALALAAFFGHTETVRVLIENGAKTEIVTRSGTSPKMWAMARTFTEAARCFERPKPAPVVVPVAVKPVAVKPAPVALVTPVAPVAVKTLKDPPEIWDLVREEPREGFKARSAFVSRVKSMNRAFALGACAVLLLAIACGVGALVLRSSQAHNLPPEVPPVQNAADATVSAPARVESMTPATPITETNEFLSAHAVKKTATRHTRRHTVAEANVIENAPSSEAPAAPPEVVTPQIEKPRSESATKSTPNTLSPQLITPAKSAPPKAKVIQWP